MTIGQLLKDGVATLTASGILTARLDCLILLEDITGRDRATLLAHDDEDVPSMQRDTFNTLLARRKAHEPLAYIRGKAMFYGRTFSVNKDVLVPRPETEALIDIVKTLSLPARTRIADIGTGSGCIGITLALELPQAHIDLYDIDSAALHMARHNAQELGASVDSYESDLLSSLHNTYDIIVTNLPYVPEGYPVNKAAKFEPEIALYAGIDGLDAYRAFWQQIVSLITLPHIVLTESLPSQHHANAVLARNHGYGLEQSSDFIQCFRAL